MKRTVPLLALVAATFLAAAPAAVAQRAQARFTWQGKEAVLDFGVPAVGKYSLESLEVGATWRLGANAATTLTTPVPLITKDTVIPPGSYRVTIARPRPEPLELYVEGAGDYMAAGGPTVSVAGTSSQAQPPSSKLEITLTAASEQVDAELRALALSITFGAPRLTVPLTMVGSTTKKIGADTLDAFTLPTTWLAARLELAKHTPIATLTLHKPKKGTPGRFNLLLSEQDALLLPVRSAPTADNGFAPLADLDPTWLLHGTVSWSEAKEPVKHLVIDEVAIDQPTKSRDGSLQPPQLRVVARTGARVAEIKVALEPASR